MCVHLHNPYSEKGRDPSPTEGTLSPLVTCTVSSPGILCPHPVVSRAGTELLAPPSPALRCQPCCKVRGTAPTAPTLPSHTQSKFLGLLETTLKSGDSQGNSQNSLGAVADTGPVDHRERIQNSSSRRKRQRQEQAGGHHARSFRSPSPTLPWMRRPPSLAV